MKRLSLLLPVLLLAACGGGEDARKAYVAKAEAICAKANGDIKALPSPTTPAAIGAYVVSLIDIADRATTGLQSLVPPPEDAAEVQRKMLVPLAKQVEEGRVYANKVAAAVRAKDDAAVGALLGSPPVQTQADTTWMTKYGFSACVESARTDR